MMAPAKGRGLGKGLEALFNEVRIDIEPEGEEEKQTNRKIGISDSEKGDYHPEDGILFIAIHDMKPNVNQPRKRFDDDKITELAESIRMHGIIQPIMVRRAQVGYEIVAGERRWRAAIEAGLKRVPCIIRELDEQQNMLIAIIENMQREDLNAIEEAQALNDMILTFGLTQEEVSKSVGKSRPYITNALRLLKLPEPVRELVIDGKLTGGHARAIAGIKEAEKQKEAAEKAAEEGLSVREIENYVSDLDKKKKKGKAKPRPKNRDVLEVENRLKSSLGTKVSIVQSSRKGKIEIEYYGREELDRLIELLIHI